MIIEFNGLPGTGKTTIANHLNELLKDKYNVCFRYSLKECRIKRYLSYLFDGTLRLYLLGILYAVKSTGSCNTEKIKIITVLIAYYRMYKMFLKNRNEKDVLIIDQGLVQALISINFYDKIRNTNEIDKILRFFQKQNISFSAVCCNCNIELSCQRIKDRNLNGGRLDNTAEGKRKRVLDIQEYNFNLINNRIKELNILETINVDTIDDPEINAEIIAKRLGFLEDVKRDESC